MTPNEIVREKAREAQSGLFDRFRDTVRVPNLEVRYGPELPRTLTIFFYELIPGLYVAEETFVLETYDLDGYEMEEEEGVERYLYVTDPVTLGVNLDDLHPVTRRLFK